MFAIRQVTARVVTSRFTTPIQPRSITTFSASLLRINRPSTPFLLQKRFASDEPRERHPAVEEAEPAQPESQSAAEFDSADVTPTEATDVPQADSAVEEAVRSATRRPQTGARQPAAPNKQVYVGNLFFDVTEEDLRREFSRFGSVTNVKIIKDPRGMSKGFGYVDYLDQTDATSAVQGLDRQVFEGRRLTVQYSTPRSLDQVPRERNKLHRDMGTAPPSRTLYIGNMSFNLTDQDLSKLFSGIKNVLDVRVAIDRRTGQPRGFAHADFTDIESAERGFEKLNGKEVYGRILRCDYSGPTSRARARGD